MKSLFIRWGKLLLTSLILFVAVITTLFVLLEISPGDTVDSLVGDYPISEEFRAQVVQAYGLDKPAWERYLIYLANVFQGDLGYSYASSKPVLELIMGRLGNTMAIALPAFMISTFGGLVIGSIAARARNRWVDGALSGMTVGLFSLPNFWLGILLIIVFSVMLGWLPSQGKSTYGAPGVEFQYAILPIITMASTELAYKARIMRSSMIETLGQDYIDTARSKGAGRNVVLWGHAMPNALLPMVTISGYSLGILITGSIVVEKVFGWPGMGLLMLDAINKNENQIVLGVVVIITISVIVVNMLTDVLYGLVDPRVRGHLLKRGRGA